MPPTAHGNIFTKIIRKRVSRSSGSRWVRWKRASSMSKSRGPMPIVSLRSAQQVRSLFQAAPGIRDNDDDWGNKIVKVVVDIDQDRARQLGITSEEVTQRSGTYFSGTAVSIYREGDNLDSDRAARRSGHVRRAWKASPAPPSRRTAG